MKRSQKIRRKLFWLAFAPALVLTLFALYFFLNDDLHQANISSNLPYRDEWEIASLNEDERASLNSLLNQPFFYLEEGGQSYVFSSADQRYVLKLFKFKRFRPSYFVSILPDIFIFRSYRNAHMTKRNQKLLTAFTGYKLSYDLHRQESGLIFIQLNPSHSPQLVSLTDRLGFKRTLNLESVAYVLQEKGEMLSTTFSRLLDQGNVQSVKECINQLFALYLSEYLKGIYDVDHGVMHNIGYVGGRLFHLDVGKMRQDDHLTQPYFYERDLTKIACKVQSWIHHQYPQYEQELTRAMEEKLSHLFGKKFNFPL